MQHLHKSTHTHWLLSELVSRLPQSDRRNYLPNLLFSVLPFISLSHPVFWPSTILFVASPPSASEPRMTPSQFPAFLSAPVSSCFCRCLFVTFLFPWWRKFSSCLYRFGQNLKKATCCLSPVYCSCGQFWSTLWTKQCSISLKFNGEGGDFQPVSIQWKPIWCSVSGQ